MVAQGIASEGAVFLPVAGDVHLRMIATKDIAEVAADKILYGQWSGINVLELVGPEEVTFDVAAKAIGEAIGKDVNHVTVTPDQAREALSGMGMSVNVVDCFGRQGPGVWRRVSELHAQGSVHDGREAWTSRP